MQQYEPPTFEVLGSLTELTLGSKERGRENGKRRDRNEGFSR